MEESNQNGLPFGIRNKWDALRFVLRFAGMLLLGLFSVLFRFKRGYRAFSKYFKETFPEPTAEEMEEAERNTPHNMRWWSAESHAPSEEESSRVCKTCNDSIGSKEIKECPNCHVVMHAECYDRPYGDSYQTPDCQACYERCYSR